MKTDTIGQKVKLLRKLRHWSQGEVAKKLEISIPALSKIEAGHTTLTIKRLQQIEAIFETSISDLGDISSSSRDIEYTQKLELTKELRAKIAVREAEIVKLQRMAITLYEELRGM